MRTPANLIKHRLLFVYWDNEAKLDPFRTKGKDVSEQELKQSYLAEGMNYVNFCENSYNAMYKELHQVRIVNAQLKEEVKRLETITKNMSL